MANGLVERPSRQRERRHLKDGRALRIGIDLDEVLAGFVKNFLDYYFEKHGKRHCYDDIISYNFCDSLGCSQEEASRAIRGFYNSEHFQQIKPINGSQEAIATLSQRHELFVITARPRSIEADTIAWIERYFSGMFGGVYLTNEAQLGGMPSVPKVYFCKMLEIDVMIEDSIANLNGMVETGSELFLLDRPWNRKDVLDAPNVQRVQSWKQIVDQINPEG